jgi:hypothetical protein
MAKARISSSRTLKTLLYDELRLLARYHAKADHAKSDPAKSPRAAFERLGPPGAFSRLEIPLLGRRESEPSSDVASVSSKALLGMTELKVLDRDISGLKELLRVAWKHLANPLLTPFERREVRNEIKHSSAELRRYLQSLEQPFGGRSVLPMARPALQPLRAYHASMPPARAPEADRENAFAVHVANAMAKRTSGR